AGTTVYYCYEVTNTGNVTLNLHDLVDSELGTIFSGFSYPLIPGASAYLVVDTVINVTTTNTATWTAYNAGPSNVVTAEDSATVTVAVPSLACNGPVEEFELGVPPVGWSVMTNEPSGPQWTTLAGCGEAGNYTNGSGGVACVSSDLFGQAEMDTSLVTPAFSLAGFTSASLTYTANYQNFANLDFLDVDISTDGGTTWTNLLSWNEDHGAFRATPGEDVVINLSAYAGQSGLRLRFRYHDPNTGDYNWYAQVDNVGLTCGQQEPPNIDVDPLSLAATQPPNTTTSQTLDIGNTGGADLTWAIDEAPASPLVQLDDRLRRQLQQQARRNLRSAPAVQAGSRAGASSGVVGPPPIAYESPADFSEGFDDITLLPGLGWYFQNNSSPLGLTDWFQGNDSVFPAHAGAPTAYIGANFNNTSGAGTISNWMLTPQLTLANGDTFSFWTRTATGSIWPDRLQVRLSLAGASTNVGSGATDVGDFTTLLLDINPSLTVGGYPEVWTQYTITLSGIPPAASGRIAFRYFVENAGPSGTNSNYIGIDTVEFISAATPGPCDAPADVPWLSVLPANGTTAGGATTPVTVTFDSTGLAVGVYNANLCVLSNDPDPGPGNGTELVVVPVSLTVEEPQLPSISLAKTVGTAPAVCATTDAITVPAGTTVYYCYEVTNTGNVTLNLHDLVDSELGTIFSGFSYSLIPGASAYIVVDAVITTTTTNTATWTAYNAGPTNVATAEDSATVTVIHPNIDVAPLSLASTQLPDT
ncbi:MAG: immune inhibitor A, partial [Acidobacteriota bacterium]